MAYIFGDSFDYYAAVSDALLGWWDGGTATNMAIVAGRFTGSQAFSFVNTTGQLFKSSGANDGIHHFIIAVRQTAVLSGTSAGQYIQLQDGTNNQCCIVFRTDGAMLLTSGGPTGTTLATYTGAISAQNVWTAFEIEVVIHNTAGSITVRKNGNPSNDFTLGSLNTRAGSTNNYANRILIAQQTVVSAFHIDDVLWRSDPTSVAWLGDIRAYQLMPTTDVSAQFSKSPTTLTQPGLGQNTNSAIVANQARYTPFTALYTGTLNTATVNVAVSSTANAKLSLFASTAGAPGAVIASATTITSGNLNTASTVFTFPSPPTVVAGTQYFIGLDADAASGQWNINNASTVAFTGTTTYASFPVSSPTGLSGGQNPNNISLSIAPTNNATLVSEAQQDAATTYVYDSTVGHQDFYNIQGLPVTPTLIFGVNTRGFVAKSDAGTRLSQLQMKSGSTTVQSTPLALSTNFLWQNRWDIVDPNTGSGWTAAGVNNIQVGPLVNA